MENSVGIEAARARLGDIADRARTTGQVTALTRHGRTVAVIGPAHAVQPANGVEVTLFPGYVDDITCTLPAVPRIGESLNIEKENGDQEEWLVTNVQWNLRPEGKTSVYVLLDPAKEFGAWLGANRPKADEE